MTAPHPYFVTSETLQAHLSSQFHLNYLFRRNARMSAEECDHRLAVDPTIKWFSDLFIFLCVACS